MCLDFEKWMGSCTYIYIYIDVFQPSTIQSQFQMNDNEKINQFI